MKKINFILKIILMLFPALSSCTTLPVSCDHDPSSTPKQINYQITKVHSYDERFFTQGVVYDSGYIYVSTGLYGNSSLNKIDIKNGNIINKITLDSDLFGEGLTVFDEDLIQLTWKSGNVFKYNKVNMQNTKIQKISTEGWGITSNNEQLITSDGTEFLYFRDPNTLKVLSKLKVHYMNRRLRNLNELEWVDNCILANIWKTNIIAIINPISGSTIATIDLDVIAKKENSSSSESMPNGIAFLDNLSEILVMGKYWKHAYQLKLK